MGHVSCLNCSYMEYETFENDWIRSYLIGRVLFTNICDSCSSMLSIEKCVSRGSIFDPLLFLIIINDVCNSIQFLKFCMYADDTGLLCSSKNIYEQAY